MDNNRTEVGQRRLLDGIAAALLIVGGLNWGLVAIAEFDLVAWLFGEVLSHETDTLDVRGRVEAKTACRARGANEAVAALPRPQQLGADAGALTQLADPEGSVAGHPKIIQQLDSFLTELRPTATVRT